MLAVAAGTGELHLVQGDITQIAADVIVNAANAQLAGGGGVDGAIHRAGGPELMLELRAIHSRSGDCPPGKAVATRAGLLPATFVFHAVGPIYRGGNAGEPAELASCYRTCLEMAAQHQLRTISFPSISTGVYAYPLLPAARIAFETTFRWLAGHSGPVKRVTLVQFSEKDHAVYLAVAREWPANVQQGSSG